MVPTAAVRPGDGQLSPPRARVDSVSAGHCGLPRKLCHYHTLLRGRATAPMPQPASWVPSGCPPSEHSTRARPHAAPAGERRTAQKPPPRGQSWRKRVKTRRRQAGERSPGLLSVHHISRCFLGTAAGQLDGQTFSINVSSRLQAPGQGWGTAVADAEGSGQRPWGQKAQLSRARRQCQPP